MSFLFGSSALDTAINSCTDENLPYGTEDIAAYLSIADKIKSNEVTPTQAIKPLLKRIQNSNPNVQIMALQLTDCLVKNSGRAFLSSIAERSFVDAIVNFCINSSQNSQLKSLTLKYIQTWYLIFRGRPELSYVETIYQTLKREGKQFPPIESASASAIMIDTQTAPEWSDSDVCMRCRANFTTFNRKHHCRACGLTFCQACSSKITALPHLGINDVEVRVCDGCYDRKMEGTIARGILYRNLPIEASAIQIQQSNFEPAEDMDLKRALEASLRESAPSTLRTQQPKAVVSHDNDEELNAAIQASLRESAQSSMRSSQPSYITNQPTIITQRKPQEITDSEIQNLNMFSSIIERLESDPSQNILHNNEIQLMYVGMAALTPKLQRSVAQTGEKLSVYSALEDKIQNGCRSYERLVHARLTAGSVYDNAAGYEGFLKPSSRYQQQQYQQVANADQYHQPVSYFTSQPPQASPNQQQPNYSQDQLQYQQKAQPENYYPPTPAHGTSQFPYNGASINQPAPTHYADTNHHQYVYPASASIPTHQSQNAPHHPSLQSNVMHSGAQQVAPGNAFNPAYVDETPLIDL